MDKEEGEMSDDPMLGSDDKDSIPENDIKPTLLYKAEKDGLVIKQLEKIDAAKFEERAKRFGLNLSGSKVVTQKQIDELYSNFGIESGNERHFRFDALHLNGVNGLSTREIFEYLEDYRPVSLEWIDDVSCNIVCQDHISAALALLLHSREIKNEELKNMIAQKSSHHWREGAPHPKNDLILMRFATNGDKKMQKKKPESHRETNVYYDESMEPPSKNPWGDLCKSWGVYDHQEVFNRRLPKNDYEDEIEEPYERVQIKNKRLAMRLGKRPPESHSEDSNSDSEWKKKSKTPRMRMHADDEESKQNKKKQQAFIESSKSIEKDVYAPLSIEVVNSRSTYIPRESTKISDKFRFHDRTSSSHRVGVNNIQSRLGAKVVPARAASVHSSSEEYSSDESDHNTMSRVQKISTTKGSSVWSRLESKATNSKDHKDLRQILKSRKQTKSDDLRDRISKSKRTGLRIEIDNN
ncbi:hypothetical protein MSG28_003394 [Choristoneura fumiferana]|uniref:Uncharacterized protein n=1 Tax=Choristoneura fumiferana TaxID=7141 RepID=A0ACC0KF24_CHOFU|nr:hypothetical protein MSG28_003394 [Choristoneura fumiferana]